MYWAPELWGPESESFLLRRRPCVSPQSERAVSPFLPPPECPDLTGKGDVWSFGLTILAVINGRRPFESLTSRAQVEFELHEAWAYGE